MKELTLLLSSLILTTLLSSNASAQNFKVGGGVYYATNLNNAGISLNSDIQISKSIHLAPLFIYFFKKDLVNWYALDLDGHYIFSRNAGMQIFGIVGLGFTFTSIEIPGFSFGLGGSTSSQTFSDTNIGVNLGLGLSKKLSQKLSLFSEAKYNISNGSYLKIGAGLLFNF